jgi:hypothetical protein
MKIGGQNNMTQWTITVEEDPKKATINKIISDYVNSTDMHPFYRKLCHIDDDIKSTVIDITNIVIDNENVEVVKSKRGRPKKHQHPGPTEIIAASV